VSVDNQDRVLVNLHGGGFVYNRGLVLGQLESVPVAAIGRIKIIVLDYRQAPRFLYPAATEDVEKVYRALLERYRPGSIGFLGFSAGGILASQAITWFHDKQLPRPGAVCISGAAPPNPPWPYGKEGDSGIWYSGFEPANERCEAAKAAMAPIDWYMERCDPNDSKAYPGASDEALAHFPSTLLVTGSREAWASSVFVMHTRLLRLGVDSALYVMEGGWHGAHFLPSSTPEAIAANTYIARWFEQRLA
jgi:acetyl esterase/lipase